MPTISLRLTDEEHEQLKTWAHDGRRSVQKELVYRLFSTRVEPEFEPIVVEVSPEFAEQIRTLPAAPPPPSYFPEREFKPDPKPERKK